MKAGLLSSLALLLLLFAGCATLPVGLSVGSLPTSDSGKARFMFYENTALPHVVTEISIGTELTLVECWKANPLTEVDYHWGMVEGEVRECFSYPAEVQDAAWSPKGFAQLRQNRSGSAVTNIGPGFNSAYQRNNPEWSKRGKVVAEDRSLGVRWTVTRVGNSYEIRIYR